MQVGGVPSPADLLLLAQGAEAEDSTDAAVEVAARVDKVMEASGTAAAAAAAVAAGAAAAGEEGEVEGEEEEESTALVAPQVLTPAAALQIYERMARLCLEHGGCRGRLGERGGGRMRKEGGCAI